MYSPPLYVIQDRAYFFSAQDLGNPEDAGIYSLIKLKLPKLSKTVLYRRRLPPRPKRPKGVPTGTETPPDIPGTSDTCFKI